MKNKKYFFLFFLTFLLISCGSKNQADGQKRWFSEEEVTIGYTIFQKNCAACHGGDAQGVTSNWRKPFSDGSYPPPPLDGSAHAWHHPFSVLKSTVQYGGMPLGGKMPAFKDKLAEEEIEAAIAYFQSKWSSEIYQQWTARGGLDK